MRTSPRLSRLAVAALLAVAGPSAALAGTFVPPQGCTAKMTVQMRGCLVAHYYTCAGDAPGEQGDTLYDSDGPYFTSRVDAEYQWIESHEIDPPLTILLDSSRDPASFSALIGTGEDRYDFTTRDETGRRLNYEGFDRLTGRTQTIDGIPLEVTEFEMTETDETGTVTARRWGNQFIHRDWRLFFSGAEMWEGTAGVLPTDNTPVLFIFPDEPGYLSTVPLFDCTELMSRAPLPRAKEADHG